MRRLFLYCLVALRAPRVADGSITAYNGFGEQVDWFFVIKLPQQTFPSENLHVVAENGDAVTPTELNAGTTHCSCPDPSCDGMPFPSYGKGRGSGLCYLYADSNNATLRYFTDVRDADG